MLSSDFYSGPLLCNGPLAKTTEERMQVLANLPFAGLVATIKTHAIDGNVDWLRSMLDGGLFDFPRQLGNEINMALFGQSDELVCGGIETWDAIATLVDHCEVSIPLRVHGFGREISADVGNPPSRFSAKAECDLRDFHRDFCTRLVSEAEAYIERAADRQAETDHEDVAALHARTTREMVPAINRSLGVALATACMLDDVESVSMIVRRFPLAVNTPLHPKVLGKNWQTAISGQQQKLFFPDRFGISVMPPVIKPTPFGCALLYSSKNAMRSLRTHAPKATRVLGHLMVDTHIPEENGVPFGVNELCHTFNIVFDQDALELAKDYAQA